MLLYEIQMNRVGATAEIETLPFDDGPLAAADTLIAYIKSLQTTNESLSANMGDLSGFVSEQIKALLTRMDIATDTKDPAKLLSQLEKAVAALQIDKTNLSMKLASVQEELDGLKAEHESTAAELATRTDREEKFRKAKQALNPSEGEVLFNSSNDIVLRLSGLSFDSGKDQIKDEHIPLLEKVKGIIEMFPEAQLMVEGHTDAQGDASANVTLSEKRAYAVMQYLRQSLLLSADQIRSMGYGADRPVASNQTADGRAKNRRIDIIIMQ
jgi:outer membrane protein OmpA-like peptidoglycan-associated protein